MQLNKNNNLTYVIDGRTIQKIQIPVDMSNGYGILPYQNLDSLEIPECLVKIENNFAYTTILNPKENPTDCDNYMSCRGVGVFKKHCFSKTNK